MSIGYNRIAGIYDGLARIVFGKSMVQSQTIFLDQLQNCKSILVLGGGTGWWLNDLLKKYPEIQITFVETSIKMISIAKKGLKFNNRVEFVYGSVESLSAKKRFDAVVLYYFVDLFDELILNNVIKEIERRLKPEATWLATDFIEEKKWHTVFLKVMYTFFNYTTDLKTKSLPDWRKVLQINGLRIIEQQSFYLGFILSVAYRSRKQKMS